jgi:hypothetical protein
MYGANQPQPTLTTTVRLTRASDGKTADIKITLTYNSNTAWTADTDAAGYF